MIYANELVSVVQNSKLKLYADDAKLFLSFPGNTDGFNRLQNDLNRVYEWAQLWQLKLSLPKCEVIHIGHRNPQNDYVLGGVTLNSVSDLRDLGVQVCKDLKFHKHIDQICAKARQRIHLLFRIFRTKSEKALIKAYISFVRPILEYCSPV